MIDAFGSYWPRNKTIHTRNYSEKEKNNLLAYMKAGFPYIAGGYVFDCIKRRETREEDVGYDDGTFSWGSDDIYYIEHYNAAVTDDFLNHVNAS